MPAVINGRLRKLTIVGVALSPEFVYSIRPGELVPDDQRYGIFWMDQKALAAAFDMEGGFNDVVLALSPGASSEEVIARLDRILEPYGGLGAIPRALQLSHWTVAERVVAASEFRDPAAVDLPARRRVHSQRRADESAGAPAAADRLAQSPRLRQRGHRLALPEVGLRHRCRRHRHWRRRRRILRLDDHRPLQRLLPFSRAELQRPSECRRRLCRVDILCCRGRHVRRRDARGAHPARRSDATRSYLRATNARCSRHR